MNLSYCPMPHIAEENRLVDESFRELISCYLNSNHRKKVELIKRAYRYACEAHSGARRMSGEPYVSHPIAVARIAVAEMGLGSTSIVAALLHEVIESGGMTEDDIRTAFGEKIAGIVSGLTKISGGVFDGEMSEQAGNFRKLLLSMSSDFRVLLVKMADRLHNLRTLDVLRPSRQRMIANETLNVYAPLAERLGLNKIKTELEDLSFRYRHPVEYAEIQRKLNISSHQRNILVERFIAPIKQQLDREGIRYEIKARVKTPYSIYKKMSRKGLSFEEIYDIFAVRIIFENDDDSLEDVITWRIRDILSQLYNLHPDRTRNWITTPKPNGYKALHITVEEDKGHWTEVQIRSRKMDDIAELGYAAHWKYKTNEYDASAEFDNLVNKIKDILSHPGPDEVDFLETIRLNLFSKEIYVFTKEGQLKALPMGATILDFAFAISEETGLHCVAGKIDHKLYHPSHTLQSGDKIEIITSGKCMPDCSWLQNCITPGGKSILKRILNITPEYKIPESRNAEALPV